MPTPLRVSSIVLLFIAIAFILGADQKPKVFASLKIGQSVTLEDEDSNITISYFDDDKLPSTHTIIDMGDNFIVVRDIADVTETTILIYSIKQIVKIRTQ